jgi:hypothetical protein
MGIARAFMKAYRGDGPSPPKALLTATGVGGAVAVGVYRLLRR